jgi:hypothetical protein
MSSPLQSSGFCYHNNNMWPVQVTTFLVRLFYKLFTSFFLDPDILLESLSPTVVLSLLSHSRQRPVQLLLFSSYDDDDDSVVI